MTIESAPAPAVTSASQDVIGTSPPRLDAWDKVTGRTAYVGDMALPGMLYGKVLWSAHPHALIRSIDASAAQALAGVRAVLTADDVSGPNAYGVAILDQQVLAKDKVRSRSNAVALVAADSEEIAEEALRHIVVDYEVLPAVFTVDDAMAPGAPEVHEGGNVLQHTTVRKGDIERGFAEADVVVEATYRTQSMDHMPMEPEATLAFLDDFGVLNVVTATQYPYRDRRQIAPNVGLPMNRIRVMQAPTGGGFGRKDDITTEIYAALLSVRTARPVRLVCTRQESLLAFTKRHPMVIEYRTAARNDGTITAIEGVVKGDTGAWASLGTYVVKKAGIHLTGPYYVPNVKVDTYTVYTNNLASGAYRGFGVLQAAVAHESQMDLLARRLRMSPLDVRLKNCLKPGLETATGQVAREGTGIEETLLRIKGYMADNNLDWNTAP